MKPGVPDSECHAESLFECVRVGDASRSKRFFRFTGGEFIESQQETEEESLTRQRESLFAGIESPAPATELKSLAPAVVPSGLRNGSLDSDDVEQISTYVHFGPLTKFVRTDGRADKVRGSGRVAARSALYSMHHLFLRAVQRGEFDRNILFSPMFNQCFVTDYDLLKMSPDMLAGMMIALNMLMPNKRAESLKVMPHAGVDADQKGSACEVTLCGKLLEHLKKASVVARSTSVAAPVQAPAAAAAAGSGAGYTTTPVTASVTDTQHRPVDAVHAR